MQAYNTWQPQDFDEQQAQASAAPDAAAAAHDPAGQPPPPGTSGADGQTGFVYDSTSGWKPGQCCGRHPAGLSLCDKGGGAEHGLLFCRGACISNAITMAEMSLSPG